MTIITLISANFELIKTIRVNQCNSRHLRSGRRPALQSIRTLKRKQLAKNFRAPEEYVSKADTRVSKTNYFVYQFPSSILQIITLDSGIKSVCYYGHWATFTLHHHRCLRISSSLRSEKSGGTKFLPWSIFLAYQSALVQRSWSSLSYSMNSVTNIFGKTRIAYTG